MKAAFPVRWPKGRSWPTAVEAERLNLTGRDYSLTTPRKGLPCTSRMRPLKAVVLLAAGA